MFKFGVDGVVVSDNLFALLDFVHQQQRDTTLTIANTSLIVSLSTDTKT